MPLTDQQLRQELVNYGETVPPITQRNREQLRARLEFLQARPRSPVKTSPSRSRSNTSATRSTTRSRPVQNLIELSDSESENSSNDYRTSRSVGKGGNIQTRSIAVGRDFDRATPISSSNVTADVEQSIARHRREIQQLIDSARDRARVAQTNTSSSQYEPPATTPLRPNRIPSRQRQPIKPDLEKPKQPSWFNRSGEAIQTFWKSNKDVIINLLRALIVGAIVGGGLIFLFVKGSELIPHRKGKFVDLILLKFLFLFL